MAAEFLAQLPTVPVESLPAGSDCPICSDTYSTEPTENGDIDSPVRLPCDHIIGGECIRKWLSSGANTCPLCRCQFFASTLHESDSPDFSDSSEEDSPVESPDENSLLLRAGILASQLEAQHARRLRHAARQAGERALYRQLQREGARLPPLPVSVPGISASEAPSREIDIHESLAPQRVDRNEEAFFEQLQRMGAFNEPIGSRMRLNDDRRLANRLRWHEHRSHGRVYYPDGYVVNGVRGGEWS